MPHLTLEHAGMEGADIPALCRRLRDAMVATGVFPLGGIRVRAFEAGACAIADGGAAEYGFVHGVLIAGKGRDEATLQSALDAVYAAAEDHLKPRMSRPFALSIELVEVSRFSIKRLNTIHDHLKARESA